MGDFGGKRWRPYLDQEARDRRDEIMDHLKRNYDGPSDFVKQKLKEEKALNLEERIQKLESEMEEKKSDLQKLKRIKQEREQQDKLRDKKELLKQKQKKLRRYSGAESNNREEVREQVKEEVLTSKPPRFSDEEYLEQKSERIERIVDQRLDSSSKVDQLVEDVQRLQKQVTKLNDGREDWFMDLDKKRVEEEATA